MTDTTTAAAPTRAKSVPPERLARFKAFRIAVGLTQEELADRAGLSRVKVCKVEKGRDKASTVATRDALSAGLGCSAAELEDVLSGRVEVVAMVRRMKRRAAAGEGVAK